MLTLLVGLLAGILIGFSVEHPTESPFAVVDAQAATELRAQFADVDAKQLDMNFWLTLCRGHSPLCAAYVAGSRASERGLPAAASLLPARRTPRPH